ASRLPARPSARTARSPTPPSARAWLASWPKSPPTSRPGPPGSPAGPAGPAGPRSGRGRALLLRELADHGVVGEVDGLEELVVRDGAAGQERVPAGAADVGHDRRVVRVALQPLVGDLAVRAAL